MRSRTPAAPAEGDLFSGPLWVGAGYQMVSHPGAFMSWWYKQRQARYCTYFALCTENIPRHVIFYCMEKSTGMAQMITSARTGKIIKEK